ncbi:MAG TPA: hypothetical protein VJ698_18280 [Noviherbaspirillum sp.]|uniref:hypothetical protein n=1 Tax=Noviherbaspirillum sp. TaxID=1926288 RepID=UPI002B4A9C7D|nr:hypothetical protein [Noviherbaspirillum sp.]HJV87422.1 hypothetical protein [Noviherbaspirillum sp.]
MRISSLLALVLLFPCVLAFASEADFSGAWVAWLCPHDVKRESGKCSNFVLELHQKDDKLCGAHFFATAGAASIDEGAAPSIMGEIVNGTASVTTISSRAPTPVRLRAEIRKVEGGLQWRRLDEPPGDYLLPERARLTKSKSRTLFAPVFAQQLTAACSSAFTMIEHRNDAAASSPPSSPPPSSPSILPSSPQKPQNP